MYRNTDPETSRLAAKELKDSGKLPTRQLEVLTELARIPQECSCTSGELSIRMNQRSPKKGIRWAAESPHRRLPELERMGLVSRGGARLCTDSHQMCQTWRATAAGRLAAGMEDLDASPYKEKLSGLSNR